MAALLSATPIAAGDPSLYQACGVRAVGNPTEDQLLCIAEGIGVPTDDHQRVVRGGFNSTFAEPTLEILHRVVVWFPNGSVAIMSMKVQLSAIDGQLLVFGPAYESVNDEAVDWNRIFAMRGNSARPKATKLAGLCGVSDGTSLSSNQLECMGRALGMGAGKHGMRVRHDERGRLGGPAWVVENTLEESPCHVRGMGLEVDARDGTVRGYGLWGGDCGHEPRPTRPMVRAIRDE